MHIQNPQSGVLSNHEVFVHLLKVRAEYSGEDGTGNGRDVPTGLKNSMADTINYVNFHEGRHKLPSIQTTHGDRPMTIYKGPHSLFQALAPKYRLNKLELLQIFNLKPTTTIELKLIIEESHTRFTDDQLEEMVQIIEKVLTEKDSDIPIGAEDQEMPKIENKLEGAAKKGRKRIVKKT